MNDAVKNFLVRATLSAATTFSAGFVLMKLWNWYMVPFIGIPITSLPFAIGFGVFVSFLTQSISNTDILRDYSYKERNDLAIARFVLVWLFFVFGALFHWLT